MKKVITFIVGGLLLAGGFAGGVVYNSNKSEFPVESNSYDEVKHEEHLNSIDNKNEVTKEGSNNKYEFSNERSTEIQKAKEQGAGKAIEVNPNCSKDDINRSVADKLKSIGVNKEEATFYKVDKDIIKYLNN